jgi:hypothetical protein
MFIRPNAVIIDDEHIPTRCAASSGEPFHKPDYKGKKHSRPHGNKPRLRWVRQSRAQWVET